MLLDVSTPPPSPSSSIVLDFSAESPVLLTLELPHSNDANQHLIPEEEGPSLLAAISPQKRQRKFTTSRNPRKKCLHLEPQSISTISSLGNNQLQLANNDSHAPESDILAEDYFNFSDATPYDQQNSLGEQSYLQYVDDVFANVAGYFRLSNKLFVIQGWDAKAKSLTVSIIYL